VIKIYNYNKEYTTTFVRLLSFDNFMFLEFTAVPNHASQQYQRVGDEKRLEHLSCLSYHFLFSGREVQNL
jgi:hypothetical protein